MPMQLLYLQSLKVIIFAAQIDPKGIDLKSIKKHKLKHPKLLYTTSSNQYPSGIQMSLDRRLELLDWADQHSYLIVEDDYDHEFSNWSTPITSIFGLDTNNRVILSRNINKPLHPSTRLGYLIVSPYLIEDIRAIYEQSLCFAFPVTQKVMSAFIDQDYLDQHIRKVVQISNERRNFFIQYFTTLFDNDATLYPMNAGLHLITKLADSINDIAFSKFLEQERKWVSDGVGFSSLSDSIIKQKLNEMAELYKAYILL